METDTRVISAPLRRIMVVGSSLAAGFGTASLEALQPNFSFKITFRTVIAFVAGAMLLAVYWRILLSPSKRPGQKRLRFTASALLAVGGLAAFLYPLRFIAPSNSLDVAIGLLAAFCGISAVIILLLWCKRFLDDDTRNNSRE
jgi:hypothetical protein